MVPRQQIKTFVLQNFLFTDDANAISDETSLIEDGVIDSTGILEIVAFVESTFGIAIADEDITPANFGSIDAMDAFVAGKRGA
jgi:acyl carrier protein